MSKTTRRDVIRSTVTGVAFLPVVAAAQASNQSPTTRPSNQSPTSTTPTNSSEVDPSTNKPKPQPKPQPKPAELQTPTRGAAPIRERMRRERDAEIRALPRGMNDESDLTDFEAGADELRKTLGGKEPLTRQLPATRIGHNLSFRPDSRDFFAIKCDGLAAESSALVARCLELRKEWDAVYSTAHAFMFDVDRFDRLDAIFRMQEANGYYDLEPAASRAELDGITSMLGPLASAAGASKARLDQMNAEFDQHDGWYQLVGWLSHISAYGSSGNATAKVVWNGVEKEVVDYCHEAATAQGRMQLANLLGQLSSDHDTRKAQLDSLKARLPNLRTRADWDQKNKRFRQLQVEAMRALYEEKHRLVNSPSGPLNFVERLNELRDNFSNVLSDGLARLPAIAEGFVTVFGYPEPIPQIVLDFIQHPDQPQPSDPVLDAAHEWLNDLGRWHARFLQREQITAVVVSVKQAIRRDEWIRFLRTGEASIPIGESTFSGQRHLRCRAISLYIAGVEGFCSASIRVPPSSLYVHADNTRHAVDQSMIPIQRHSRVTAIDAVRPSDRIGLNALYNCSPLGNWTVSLADETSIGTNRDRLEDVFLEIILAHQ